MKAYRNWKQGLLLSVLLMWLLQTPFAQIVHKDTFYLQKVNDQYLSEYFTYFTSNGDACPVAIKLFTIKNYLSIGNGVKHSIVQILKIRSGLEFLPEVQLAIHTPFYGVFILLLIRLLCLEKIVVELYNK